MTIARDEYVKAANATVAARLEYTKTWRKDPTSRNYSAIDKALAALQEAERNEEAAARRAGVIK